MRPFLPSMSERHVALYVAASLAESGEITAGSLLSEAAKIENFLRQGLSDDAAKPSPAQRAKTEQVNVSEEDANRAKTIHPFELFGRDPLINILRNRDLVARLSLVGINTAYQLALKADFALTFTEGEELADLAQGLIFIISRAIEKLPNGEVKTLLCGKVAALEEFAQAMSGGCPGCEHCMGGEPEMPPEVAAIAAKLESMFGPGVVEFRAIKMMPGESPEQAIARTMRDEAAQS